MGDDHARSQPKLDDDVVVVVGDNGGVFRSKEYLCEKCGQGFGSLKGVYGHMRVHSKRSRAQIEESAQEKRLKMGLKLKIASSTPSFSTSSKSQPVISVFDEEVEEAAVCLMMLSGGLRIYNNEDDEEKRTQSEFFVERVIIRDDRFNNFNVKMGSQFSESGLQKVEICIQGLEISNSSGEKTGIADSEVKKKISKTKPKTGIADDDDNNGLGGRKRIRCSGFMKSKVKKECVDDNPIQLGSTEDVIGLPNSTVGKCRKIECPVCFKLFASNRALGGHKRIHFTGPVKRKVKKECVDANLIELGSTEEVIGFPKKHECSVCFKVFESNRALGGHKRIHFTGSVKSKVKKERVDANRIELGSTEEIGFPKKYECSVCFKVFASSQGLGSHKRSHFTGSVKRKVKKEHISDILDLNLPPNAADGHSKDAMEIIPDSTHQIFYPP